MANYTPTFTKPYPSGWVDKPSKTTPATAAIMNSYDAAIATLEAYLRDNAIKNVSADTTVKSGTKTATITIDGTEYVLYSPSVSYESAITGGTKVGTITVGSNTFDIYAPSPSAGGSTVSVVPKTLTGTNIAEITVDGTTYQLYAPTGGSTVTAEATLTEGTQIGKITIDGIETILYAPTASTITVDSELSATSENAVQNKAITEEFQKYANGTKVVAKATEAETAKTAASATTAQSATTAENATKATQDAQGNVIDTTYAKKTEVPQGTVVDDTLSSTSTNPVQNKVVKSEFDHVNSNLSVIGKCKNLLNPTLQTTTMNGVTCTNNGDGTYTLNGTASGLTTFILRDMKLDSSLSYKLTGCPLGGDWNNGYSMYVEKQYWGIDVGKGYEITLTDASNLCGFYIRIIKGTVCNNLVFKPMITTNLNATYDDFVPYTGDGETLTHDVAEIKNDLGGLSFSVSGTTLSITDGANTWTLSN